MLCLNILIYSRRIYKYAHRLTCVLIVWQSKARVKETDSLSMDKESSRWKFHRLDLALQTPYMTHVITGNNGFPSGVNNLPPLGLAFCCHYLFFAYYSIRVRTFFELPAS